MGKRELSNIVDLDSMNERSRAEFLSERALSLKPNEIERILDLLGRNPTIVELYIFNTMWSEHCSYKSSKRLLKAHLPTEGPHVVLGPGEDAGIIRFARLGGKSYCLVMAHESHNHPSQVLPVEGAATGVGGIVRDVYCMGADVIGVMDSLRFGDADGTSARRVREIARGVVDGIAQYANPLGVPNLGGDTLFDTSYDDNCLVNVVALGVVEEAGIVRSRVPAEAREHGYQVILIGKPTDASGFGGAAFASGKLSDEEALESHEAVQIPDPFLKRVLVEGTKNVLKLVRERGLTIGFKDLGAGGISCAVSEMAAGGGFGADLDLDLVNRSPEDLAPEVIACSETQERFAMAAPSELVPDILRVYNEEFELPTLYTGAGAFVVGCITGEERFVMRDGDTVVCDAHVRAITAGIEYRREAKRKPRVRRAAPSRPPESAREALLRLLSSDNVASKELVHRHYDTEVQGKAVLRPGEADAAVHLFLPDEKIGVASAVGGSTVLGCVDPYLAGVWSVIEAVRNVACVGAIPLAITDCLNYGDPEDPYVFGEFTEGVRGIGEACRELRLLDEVSHGLPVVSGNVSFYNQSERGEPIAPTPIVACAGRVEDVSTCRGMGLKGRGSNLILLGKLHKRTGGSEYERLFGDDEPRFGEPPLADFESERRIVRTLVEGFRRGLIDSAHDVGHGGLGVALAEMVYSSDPRRVGCRVEIEWKVDDPIPKVLFSEYCGVIVEVARSSWSSMEELLSSTDPPWSPIGETKEGGILSIRVGDAALELGFEEMGSSICGGMSRIFGSL